MYDHDDVLLLVKTVTEPPPDGATRWTMEAIAGRMSEHGVPISASQVWRICRALDLKPWQTESWMTSHDPDFWAKAADVCGLYLNPPRQRRGVVGGREVRHPSQEPGQPDPPGSARHPACAASSSTAATAPPCCSPGSTCTTATSPAGSPTRPARTNFVDFLADLDAQTPAGHGTALHRRQPLRPLHRQGRDVPRPAPARLLHNTPTHASWLNQVELFFSILERRLLRHGEFDSVDDLADRIIAFIKDYNRRARPFRWTYDGRPLKVA